MKNKKLLLLIFALLLCGCHKKEEIEEPTPTPQEQEEQGGNQEEEEEIVYVPKETSVNLTDPAESVESDLFAPTTKAPGITAFVSLSLT